MSISVNHEVRRNFDYFQSVLSEWLSNHEGRFALIREQRLIEFFDNPGEAALTGADRYDDGCYSIQRVTDRPVDLGFLSYGSGDRPAS